MDEEGFLYIVDRKKDMIITGGFNVYSSEVEQIMMSIEGVSATAVFGAPDETWGEEVVAVVQLTAGVKYTQPSLIAICKEIMGSVKAPKSIVFVDNLPLTTLGKIDKKSLRTDYLAQELNVS